MGFFAKLLGRESGPDATELQAMGAKVIDVRTRGEFQSGHIAGARNIDVDSPGFASAIKSLNKRHTYVVYCHSGMRARSAISQMTSAGLTVVNGGSLHKMQSAGWKTGA